MCTQAGGGNFTEKQREKPLLGCSLEAGKWSLRRVCGSCSGSPGVPLTTMFGFLLSLASFILFVPNIYNYAQAQPR